MKSDSLKALQKEVGQWADGAMPLRTYRDAFDKLALEEIPELWKSPMDPDEYADVAIILFDLAYMAGIDIEEAVKTKLNVLRKSGMKIDPVTGVMKRNKDDDTRV